MSETRMIDDAEGYPLDLDEDEIAIGSCDECEQDIFADAVFVLGGLQLCEQCAWRRSQVSSSRAKKLDRVTALDEILGALFHNKQTCERELRGEPCSTELTLECARAELLALRQRCADAEMMLRAAIDWGIDSEKDGRHFCWVDGVDYLESDERGLPILTPAARAALGQNTEEEK